MVLPLLHEPVSEGVMHYFFPGKLGDMKCLSQLGSLVTGDMVQYYIKDGQHIDRRDMDGIITFTANIGEKKVGIVWTDFRVGGGSFSTENSKRLSEFIKVLELLNLPLIFYFNSLGARFMASRTLFDNAFGVIPDLYRFSKKNLFLGVSIGKTLGLSALFFAQSHYRISLEDQTQINLTGPEVHKKFFGSVDDPFERYTTSEHQFGANSLVHEILDSVSTINERCKTIINFSYGTEVPKQINFQTQETEQGALVLAESHLEKLADLKKNLADEMLEVYEQRSSVVRTYIGKMANGSKVGFLVNPPGHPNNLLTVNSIDRVLSALRLFKILELPVVSVLDCPGGDPRRRESDKDALVKIIELCHTMIDYPFAKMGIINGRCFGGSGMFLFPKIFGGARIVAVKGSQLGVMHKSIIAELLAGSPNLLETWKKFADTEKADLSDLIESGTIDAVIEKNQIRSEIENFINAKNDIEKNNNGGIRYVV